MFLMALMPAAVAYNVLGLRSTGRDDSYPLRSVVVQLPSFQSRVSFSVLHCSLRAGLSSHQRRGTRAAGETLTSIDLRRNAHPCEEEAVVDSTSMLPRRPDGHEADGGSAEIFAVDDGTSMLLKKSVGQEVDGGSAEMAVNVADDSGTTRFFYDELREAAAVMKERTQAAKSLDLLLPGPTQNEGPFQLGDAEGESGTLNWDALQDLDTCRPGRLPIESNGPPMAVLQPYLSPENAQEKPNEKLRRLPLIMPYKLRPLGLPRASLRRRLGVFPSRNFTLTDQVHDFNISDLAVDIRALPVKTRVSRVLKKWVWRLKKGSLAKTVQELGHMQLPERALQVVMWLQKHPHLWPDDTTLCAVIQVMVEVGRFDSASELQATLGRDSTKAAQTLAFALANAGRFMEAVDVLNYIKQAGWKIDGSVHAKLIEWACRTGGKGIVESLLKDIDVLELKLTLQDYTTIMTSCSKLGLVESAESVYLNFKGSGLRPDVVIYTARLSALIREGKQHEAEAFFANFGEVGCTPDLFAYQVMLDSYAKLEDLEMSMKVFHDLRNAGFDPSPEVYDILIQLHHKSGFTSVANDLIREMQVKEFVPSAQTLSCLSTVVAL